MDRIAHTILKTRVSASSLLEVITALIIISIVFSLASSIYLNVQKSNISSKRFSSTLMLDEVFASTVKQNQFVNKEVAYGETTVYQEVREYGTIQNLYIITLEARDNEGKLLQESKHLVYDPF